MDVMATINQYVSEEVIRTVSKEYGFTVSEPEEEKKEIGAPVIPKGGLVPRAPIVTVMGHVDHGKTTLLDAIRKTHIAEKEIGAITQHIGAYKVKLEKGEVVFLDTPGHAAFTSLRARGAKVTDIIVLVVAADDGIMPQTVEAINHARAAQVPIVVAINKIDRPNAKSVKVKQELMKYDLTPEDLGGKTICVEVSATKGIGIDNLLEMLLLEAELLELKADPSKPGRGTIIEASMDKRKGAVATVLVQDGTLKIGDIFVAGLKSGKVRAMTDEKGKSLVQALPSTPVEILGFSDVPYAGDSFEVVLDEKTSQEIIFERKAQYKKKPRTVTLGNLYEEIQAGVKELKIIIKADVRGSIDALSSTLENLSNEKVMVRLIHRATGDVNESDVVLASASQAIIIGFNVGIEEGAKEMAGKQGVDVRFYQVIYNALNDVKNAMSGMLEPVYRDVFTGRAEVRQVFTLPSGKKIAGCYVLRGKIVRGAKANIMRGKEKVFEGKVTSLKRFKDDVHDVQEGYECGIGIEGFNDLKEYDLIEIFIPQEVI
jgi:translation initiation factor IF-2